MKNYFLLAISMFLFSHLFSQQKPSYPEPEEGFKRVDFILPKIDNQKNYKVEIRFSFEFEVDECAEVSFSFNPKNLKEEFLIPSSYRYQYYVITSDDAEITEGFIGDCHGKKKIMKKVLSSQSITEEYNCHFITPFV
ncbi:MAG: ecotin family protein, partial [Bacteroidia bacterium]